MRQALWRTEVDCWGDGSQGFLGDGSTDDSGIAQPVVGVDDNGFLSGAVSLASGNATFARSSVQEASIVGELGHLELTSTAPIQPGP